MKARNLRVLSLVLVGALTFSILPNNWKVEVKAQGISKEAAKAILTQKMDKLGKLALSKTSQSKKLDKANKDDVVNNKDLSRDPSEKVRVIVQLNQEAASEGSAKNLSPTNSSQLNTIKSAITQTKSTQSTVISKVEALTGEKVKRSYGYLVNGFSITAKRGDISKIAAISGVKAATEAKVYYPDMTFAKNLTQTYSEWKDLGFKGEGMVVAIVDTGIDYTHKDLSTAPDSPKITSISPVGPGKFYTPKVPYGYNFADGNDDVIDRNPSTEMHGMHVAGIVGADGKDSEVNDLKAIQGVAPEAQLLAMKVFSNNPETHGAYDDDVIAAIEDSVLHGADVINMSLGSTAGFQDPNDPEQLAVKHAVDNGVAVVISAGNSAISSTDSGWNVPVYNLLGNVDTSTVGTPGVSEDALTVASYENTDVVGPALDYTSDTENSTNPFVYGTSEVDPAKVLKDAAGYEIVDCGTGKNSVEGTGNDIDAAKVSGKIALVQKVSGTYGNKKLAAQNAGAIGVIFYNAEGDDSIVSTAARPDVHIPCITLSYTNGAKLKSLISSNLKVHFNGKLGSTPNTDAGDISPYTSWGPTPNLEFKPEITAPGGDIYSLANNDSYQTMSGTSMASPFTAGSEALILEAAKKNLGLSGRDLVEFAKKTAINTAKVEMDKYSPSVPYSPRRQGAGMVQIEDAISNRVIVTGKDGKATVALKQFNDKSVTFTLNVKNYGDKDLAFTMANGGVLAENQDAKTGEVHDYSIAGSSMTFNNNSVTVPAKSSKQVDVTVALPDSFSKQQFVEGYVKLASANGSNPSLVVPYLGFYGDWSALQTVDKPMWDKDSLIGATGLGLQNPLDGSFNPYGTLPDGSVDPDKIAISTVLVGVDENTPPEDIKGISIKPIVAPNLYLLRNAKQMKAQVLDADKNVLGTIDLENKLSKDILEDDISSGSFGSLRSGAAWDGTVYDSATGGHKKVVPGQYYIRITTTSDVENSSEQTLDMPVKVDETAPVVTINSDKTSDGSQYNLQWNAVDDYVGVDKSLVAVLVNGVEISKDEYKTLKNVGDDYNVSVNVKTGMNNVVDVVTADYAGNLAFAEQVVKAGVSDAVSFDNLENDMKFNVDAIKVTGTVEDAVSKLLINDGVVPVKEDKTFAYDVQLKQGVNTIKVSAEDKDGNTIYTNDFSVSCDTSKPVINIVSPTLDKDGYLYTDKAKVTVSGNVQDSNLASILVNGEEVTPDAEGNFTTEIDVTGNTFVYVLAVDTYGNFEEKDFTVVSQAIVGPFTIIFNNLAGFMVLPKEAVKNDELVISGMVSSSTPVFKINGTDVTINKDLTFSAPVKLKQGTNTILVYAEDADGNVLYNYGYKVLYDSQAPKLTITDPVASGDGKVYTNKDSVVVKGSVSDNTYGYVLGINGNVILNVDRYPATGDSSNGKSFEYTVPMKESGIIKAQLVDEFGNVTEDVMNVVVDKTAPKAPVLTPNVDLSTKTNKDVLVSIAANSEDTDIAKVEYSFNNSTWLLYNEPVKVVANSTVYARVTDLAGNITTGQLKVDNIDKVSPVVTLSGVTDGGLYKVNVTPKVDVVDDSTTTVTMKLDGSEYKGDAITAEGVHKLEVSVQDAAGNVTQLKASFTIDKTAPVITIDGVSEGKVYNNKVAAKVTANEGTLTVTLDGKAYNGEDITAQGTHKLSISAVDAAGNTSTKSVSFTIQPALGTDKQSSDDLTKTIAASTDKTVNVALTGTTTIPKSLFESISSNKDLNSSDKVVSFTVNSNNTQLQYSFNVKDIDKNNLKDIDLSLNAQAPNKDTIGKIDSNAQILSFKDNGVLPAPLTIKLKLDASKVDLTKPIYFYYYNPSTKSTELIAGPLTADKDGYVVITIKHCSDYFFTNNDNTKVTAAVAALPKTGSAVDMNVLVLIGSLIAALGVALFVSPRRRRLQ